MKVSRWKETLDIAYVVSQLIGAVAVVVSVLYLARQVEAGNDLNRQNTYRTIFQGLSSFSNDVFGRENADLMVKGYRDLESLSPAELMSFDWAMTNYFNYIEDSYNSVQVGLLAPSNQDGWAWWLQNRVFPYRGAMHWWSRGRELFPEEFRRWLDEQADLAEPENDVYGINASE